jgi:hypothetical protein
MTAASLLARLKWRPPPDSEHRKPDGIVFVLKSGRAEFDRALLLDAVEHYFAQYEQRVFIDRLDGLDVAEDALRTIVATLRSEP